MTCNSASPRPEPTAKDVLLADKLIMIKSEDVQNFIAEIIFSDTG